MIVTLKMASALRLGLKIQPLTAWTLLDKEALLPHQELAHLLIIH